VIDVGLIKPIVGVLANGDYMSQKEASWVLLNITSGGSHDQISCIIRSGALPPLVAMLGSYFPEVVMIVLHIFKNILSSAANDNSLLPLVEYLAEIGFVDKVKVLQNDDNGDVCQMAKGIVKTLWDDKE